jgi:hypothetical protein
MPAKKAAALKVFWLYEGCEISDWKRRPVPGILEGGNGNRTVLNVRLGSTCGRRPGKSFFDVGAALVGCGHVSGLLMRRGWPLALMLFADRVPIVSTHLEVR